MPKRTAIDRSAGPATRSSSRERRHVGDGDVLGVGEWLGRELALHRRPEDVAGALARLPRLARRQERPAQHGSGRALRLGQVHVARRQREAVGLADGRVGDDLGPDREVARHLADHEELLRVLLAEVRAIGADEVEQDRDDRRDALEMARPGRALERLADRADADDRVEARRVDLVDRRREHDVGALLRGDLDVAVLVARVLLEVGGVAELARVHEDRDDGRRVLGPRATDQRAMALVQPAHGRHEADRPRRSGEGIASSARVRRRAPSPAHRDRVRRQVSHA